jgi:hypothetical protein
MVFAEWETNILDRKCRWMAEEPGTAIIEVLEECRHLLRESGSFNFYFGTLHEQYADWVRDVSEGCESFGIVHRPAHIRTTWWLESDDSDGE